MDVFSEKKGALDAFFKLDATQRPAIILPPLHPQTLA